MGRNAQPVELILAKGRSHHLTKAEIEKRKAVQIKTGQRTFKASEQVMTDPVALAKFKQLKKLFKDIEFVEGLDENLINRYCLTYSQLQDLLEYRAATAGALGFDEMLKLDARIDKKQDLLIKMEDRMFLNPVARLKNVPKKEPQKRDEFGELFD
ncbi:MAG: hypothetical protein K6U74_01060 [Firmicutes bacterium]|nr:hypothetical protein [Bacillota bacterium]